MKRSNRQELLKEMANIHKGGVAFFKKASDALQDIEWRTDRWGVCDRNEFWNMLEAALRKKSERIITNIVNIAPLISESARLTTYLSQSDQIDLGHAIKGAYGDVPALLL